MSNCLFSKKLESTGANKKLLSWFQSRASLLLIISLLSLNSKAQIPVDWGAGMGSEGLDQLGGIAADQDGNTYITGYFEGTMDIDPGPAVQNVNSGGSVGLYVQKLSRDGALIWSYVLGAGSQIYGYDIDVDNQGNVYVVGSFVSAADFDAGPGTTFLVGPSPYGAFVMKLNSSGGFAWAKSFSSSGGSDVLQIEVDSANALYISGIYAGTLDANPSAGTNEITSSSGLDIFVIKLNAGGNYIWARTFGADEYQMPTAMALDASSNVIIAGDFAGSGDFDPTTNVFNITATSNVEMFAVKMTTGGDFTWAQSFGTPTNDEYILDVATDGDANIILTGTFTQPVDFDNTAAVASVSSAGSVDVFLVKLNADGTLNWARSLGSTTSDMASAITVDENNNIYLSTNHQLSIDFDLNEGTSIVAGPVGGNITVAKYAADSQLLWTSSFGGDGTESPKAMTSIAEDVIYVAGTFLGNTSFESGDNPPVYINAGNEDAFVVRMACISFGVQNTSACFSYQWPVDGLTYTSSGTYTGVTPNALGCDSIVTLNLSIQLVNDVVTQNGATLTASQAGASYQWYVCGEPNELIDGATNQTFTATSNGNYTVEITLNECSVFSDCSAVTSIGVEELSHHALSIFPNPSTDHFLLNSNLLVREILLMDVQGKIALQQNINDYQTTLDAKTLPAGVYFVRVRFDNGDWAHEKLIIQ